MFSFGLAPENDIYSPDVQRRAMQQGLQGFGSAILSRGYSPVPRGPLEGVGAGVRGYQSAFQDALNQGLAIEELKRRREREAKQDTRADNADTRAGNADTRQATAFDRTEQEAQRKLAASQKLSQAIQNAQKTGRDILADPEILGALAELEPTQAISLSMKDSTSTPDIKEFQYAQSQGFKGGFEDWMQRKRQGAGEFGLNPIWGVDAQGNPSFIQPGKNGSAIQGKLPPGFQIARDPIKMDAGTEWILLDPQTRQPVGRQPKNVQGEAQAKEVGKETGAAQVNLPSAISSADTALKVINDIRNHPGKATGVGVIGGLAPAIPGTAQAGFVDLVNQAKGTAFLQAFTNLKGGGAISEVEGAKATQAIARLERARRPEDFDQALSDLESVIKIGKENAAKKAGAAPIGAKRLKYNPTTGELE